MDTFFTFWGQKLKLIKVVKWIDNFRIQQEAVAASIILTAENSCPLQTSCLSTTAVSQLSLNMTAGESCQL